MDIPPPLIPTKVILKDAHTRQILQVPYTVHYVFEDEVFPPENVPKERSVVVEMARTETRFVEGDVEKGKGLVEQRERAVVEKCCSYSTACQVTECIMEEGATEAEGRIRDDKAREEEIEDAARARQNRASRGTLELVMTISCVTTGRPKAHPEPSSMLDSLGSMIAEFQQRNEVIRGLLKEPTCRS